MLYREIIAVCSEIHTKHINTLCGQNVKPRGTVHKLNLCVLRKWLSKRTTSFIAVSAGNFQSSCKSIKPVCGLTIFHSFCCRPFCWSTFRLWCTLAQITHKVPRLETACSFTNSLWSESCLTQRPGFFYLKLTTVSCFIYLGFRYHEWTY